MIFRRLPLVLGLAVLSGCGSDTASNTAQLTPESVLGDCKRELDLPDYGAAAKDCALANLWLQRVQPESLLYAESAEKFADVVVRNNPVGALINYQAALGLREKLGDKSQDYQNLQTKVAKTMSFANKWPETQSLLNKMLPEVEAAKGKDSLETAEVLNRLGVAQLQLKNPKEAEANLNTALEIRKTRLEANDPLMAETYNNLGFLKQISNDNQAALDYYQKAVNIQLSQKTVPYTQLFDSMSNLAEMKLKLGQTKAAEDTFNQLLTLTEKGFSSDSLQYAMVQYKLGYLALVARNYAIAENLLSQARLIREKHFGINNINTADAAYNQALAMAAQGKIQQALPAMKYAVSFTQLALGESNPQTQQRWQNLVNLENALGGKRQAPAAAAPVPAAAATADKKAKK